VREVGFLLSDGTVFAVWSHPTTAIAYKAANVDLLLAYDLELLALPADSVTVVSTGAGLNLAMATELARIASAAIEGMLRELRTNDRCAAIERRVDASDKAMALASDRNRRNAPPRGSQQGPPALDVNRLLTIAPAGGDPQEKPPRAGSYNLS